jgi:hypothetical protein
MSPVADYAGGGYERKEFANRCVVDAPSVLLTLAAIATNSLSRR